MSIAVTVTTQVKVVETFEGVFVNPADRTATFDGLSETTALSGASAVPATKHAEGELALVAGAATLDLTNLPGVTAEETVDGTGLKVQVLKLRSKNTNANKLTVGKGATNGYGLNAEGDAWSRPLSPGQRDTFEGDDAAPDIDATHRTIDVTGTGTDVLEYAIVMG